jgi:carbonic anhydrase
MKLNRLLKSSLVAVALSASLLAGTHGTHWGYTGHESNWGELSPEFAMCKDGVNQSPINIVKSDVVATKGLEKIKFNYVSKATKVVNNGHTIQVNVASGSSITVDGIEFELKQFHFHTPSENKIDNKHFPLEAHFVHASKDGKLAVVAVMFEDGKENSVLKQIWSKMPQKVTESSCGLDSANIKEILPANKAYYRFSGSLTTPPCSEGVRWFVMQEYSHISKSQVEKFAKIVHGHNNRDVLPLNARKVIK